jgi:hypothetical protein
MDKNRKLKMNPGDFAGKLFCHPKRPVKKCLYDMCIVQKKKIIAIILCFIIIGFVFPQDTNQLKPPAPPRQPTAPTGPVVPGASNNIPLFPSFPSLPNRDNSTDGSVSVVESYYLTVSGAFPNGNTGNNVANTIKNAEYILYSNRAVTIKLLFNNGSEYIYYLKNPRSKIEIRTGVFRETFETTVQAGKDFLLEQYSSELSYTNNTITSFVLIGNNRVIVILNLSKK